MGTLLAEFRLAYDSQAIANLTNPNDPEPTAEDSAVLTDAGRYVEAEFKIEIGRAYDATDDRDALVGVEGLYLRLLEHSGQGGEGIEPRYKRYLERLQKLREKLLPKTNSTLTKTVEPAGSKPIFDVARFAGVCPNPPS